MEKIVKYLFCIPFKADLLYRSFRINRIGSDQFSIQIISDTSQFLPFQNRGAYLLWNFRLAGYCLPFLRSISFHGPRMLRCIYPSDRLSHLYSAYFPPRLLPESYSYVAPASRFHSHNYRPRSLAVFVSLHLYVL